MDNPAPTTLADPMKANRKRQTKAQRFEDYWKLELAIALRRAKELKSKREPKLAHSHD